MVEAPGARLANRKNRKAGRDLIVVSPWKRQVESKSKMTTKGRYGMGASEEAAYQRHQQASTGSAVNQYV